MEDVTIKAGEIAFQENDVRGAGETVGGDFDYKSYEIHAN